MVYQCQWTMGVKGGKDMKKFMLNLVMIIGLLIVAPTDSFGLQIIHSLDDYIHPNSSVVESITDKIIESKMTDDEKIVSIYNYLTTNVKYDQNELKLIKTDMEFGFNFNKKLLTTDVDTLNSNLATCSGFAFAFATLCESEDIEAYVVFGYIISDDILYNHAWNIVTYKGKHIEIDASSIGFDVDYMGRDDYKVIINESFN